MSSFQRLRALSVARGANPTPINLAFGPELLHADHAISGVKRVW